MISLKATAKLLKTQRLNSSLNSMSDETKKTIIFAEFVFEVGSNLLFRNGEVVPLEPMAGRVLSYLLEKGGQLVSKDEILDAVWRDVFTTEDVLKRAVSQIRRALGDDANNPRFIETHHRRGYRFIIPDSEKNGNSPKIVTAETDEPNFDCFIGRGDVMNFLQTEFRRILRGENGQPVLISGEPGIGKTQTATRLADWARDAENALPLRVRFFDYEASYIPPFDLFLDLLHEACNSVFETAADKKDLRGLIEAKLDIVLPDELLVGANSGWRESVDASRAIAPLAECFVRLSRFRPVVLLLDDVQWADETSRNIIGYLMRIAADAPLMLVGLTRRAEAENSQGAFARWLQTQAVYRSFTTLYLSPLSLKNCRELIGEVFGGRLDTTIISDKDLQKLHSATEGNPYFIAETLRLLLNEKVIEKSDSNGFVWHWHGLSDVPLPETVRMAARAKLVNLLPETLDLIECSSVLGDAFQIETLEQMLKSEGEKWTGESFETHLDEAINAQILTEQNVSGTDDCQFYHTTLRRAVYMDLSPRRRKRLHARAAHAIEKSHFATLERTAAALGAHWESAGDFPTSFQWNMLACRAAARRFDWAEAAELLSRAERVGIKLREAKQISDDELLKFLSLRGEVYMSVGRRVEAEKVLLAAAAFCEKKSDDEAAIVFLNLGRTRILLGKYREAIPVLEKSLEISQKLHDLNNSSAALIQLASAKYALCEYEASCEILQKIIDVEPVTSYNRAVALGKLGWTRALQARYREAKKLLEQALEFHDTAGDLRERAVLAMCLNWAEHGTGNYESAVAYANRARAEAQIVGEPYNESMAMMRIAKTRIAQGLYGEAETLLLDTGAMQKNLDSLHAEAETLWMIGRLRTETGDFAQAAKDLQTALEMIVEVGDKDDEFRILLDQAVLQNRLGNFAEAIDLANQAAKIAEQIEVSEGIGEILIQKSQAQINLKKFKEGIKSAETAVQILEKSNSGERWQAFFALAESLIAAKDSFAKIESALRRALELLEQIRQQFSPADEARRRQFTISQNAPAKTLHGFLKKQGRDEEAEEIRQLWLID